MPTANEVDRFLKANSARTSNWAKGTDLSFG
jgi:hypothetical protein